jgi:hypothetical protein
LEAKNVDELINFETEKLLVGAAIGEGIGHTSELQSVKYNEAMSGQEKEKWKKAIVEEHERVIQNAVWIQMKLKENGDFRVRITAQGFYNKKECIIGAILLKHQ